METKPIPTSDVSFDSAGTKCWFLTPAECPLLAAHGMARVGIDDTCAGYQRVRLRPSGSFIMEATKGEGRILLEGKWRRLSKGEAAMAPPRVLNAFYTPPGRRWKIAWIRYDEPPQVRPLINSSSPLRVAGQSRLTLPIEGLRDEWEHEREPTLLRHWLAIIDSIARRFSAPWKTDDRLAQLWAAVSGQIDFPWTLQRLAARVGFSAEHLRRISLHTLGRAPMEHLTHLRIQRAQELLEAGSEKIETVARMVGYSSGHAFSRAFQRRIGLLPSECRGRE